MISAVRSNFQSIDQYCRDVQVGLDAPPHTQLSRASKWLLVVVVVLMVCWCVVVLCCVW